MSDGDATASKLVPKQAKASRPRTRQPASKQGPKGYVAMHEVNAAMCLAGGILGPRFEAGAARDHHWASGHLQIEPNEPTAESLAGAKGDLSYGDVVVFEVNLPGGGELAIPALPLLRATRLVFNSEQARDLFKARMSGFADIPDDLLPMVVQASLFAAREQSNQAPLLVPDAAATASTSPDSEPSASAALVRRFREIDRCAGGLLAAVSTLQGSPASFRLIGRLGANSLGRPGGSPVEQFASELALMVDPSSEAANFAPVFASIAEVLESGAMDDGFSATALLREAEAAWARHMPADSPKPAAVEKFWAFTRDVLSLRREVPEGAWTDEGGSALARGALLFLLNPEPEQLEAVRERTPNLGASVHFVAGLLVGLRSGLTRLGRDTKAARAPFLAGAAFVHDWFRGNGTQLSVHHAWNAKDGGRTSTVSFEATAIATAKEMPDPFVASLRGALRRAGVEARFLEDTGELAGKLGQQEVEATFAIAESSLSTFPRQQATRVYATVPVKAPRRAAEAAAAEVNSGTSDHRVAAQVVETAAGRSAVQMSVFLLKPSHDGSLEEALDALCSKSRWLVSMQPVATASSRKKRAAA